MVAIAVFLLVSIGTACADDTVILKPSSTPGSPRKITGTITEYTGKQIFIRLASGRETSLPAERVEEISTTYTKSQLSADASFAQNDFATALAGYKQALEDEQRTWARRQILAQIVWCQQATGRYDQAGMSFLLMYRSDPNTQLFDAIPLSWRAYSPSFERQALSWIADEKNPVAQLIGASWLLTAGANQRAAARQTLQTLTQNSDARVAQLAEAQLWRTELVTSNIDDARRWQTMIDRMPDSLRAGPYYLLGQLLARHDQHDAAALAFMRVPILYSRQRTLAAESLLGAAEQLENKSQSREAASLLQELASGYPDSPAAEEAKAKLTRKSGS